MKVDRLYDVSMAIAVVSHETIFDEISEDGATIADVNFDVLNQIWLCVEHEDRVIGVVQMSPKTSMVLDSHIHILPEHRAHSKEAGKAITGKKASVKLAEEAGALVGKEVDPTADVLGSVEYKQEMAGVLTTEIVGLAIERALQQ